MEQKHHRAAAAAASANTAANAAWERAAAYNAEEAQKVRDWQERMANTVYQRTVKDMIKAGINPVLAAGNGLGTASVSSGAQATMGNPMSYMANTYADSMSASQSHGSSWNEASSGIALLADALKGLAEGMTSANNISIAINGLEKIFNQDQDGDGTVKGDEKGANILGKIFGKNPIDILDKWMSDSSPKRQSIYNGKNKNIPGTKNYQPWQYHNNGL